MKLILKLILVLKMIDITTSVQAAIDKSKISKDLCIIFSPHTTAAITINKNADL